MSRRLEVELTSTREDGSWTWRAAGAKVPRGTVPAGMLPFNSKVGDVLKIEAEFDIDGVTVLSIVAGRDKPQKATFLTLVDTKPFVGVTEKLAKRKREDRQVKAGEKRKSDRTIEPRADKRKTFTPPPPDLPKRPSPKRLKVANLHRKQVLETVSEEQRGVAEQVLKGGINAVREAIKTQNKELSSQGKPTIKGDNLLAMAQDLLPKLKVAEWLDKAHAARGQLELLDLRDLRVVVAASTDPVIVRDKSTTELAAELKLALRARQDDEFKLWVTDIKFAIEATRIVRALKLSGEPPKAGALFPTDLADLLVNATNLSLAKDAGADRWIAVLEALAFSPVRSAVSPTDRPLVISPELTQTVTRLAPLLPQIANLFSIEVKPDSPKPRPIRPAQKRRHKPTTAKAG